MSKININNVSFQYTGYYQPVFAHVTLALDSDWKLGLIGRNGRGKSTFLNLITGNLQPDEGTIQMISIPQLFPYETDQRYENTMDVVKENIGGLCTMERTMAEIIDGQQQDRMEEYQLVLSDYLEADGYNCESRIRKELNQMGLPEELLEQDYDTLSGGEKTRMQIIALFLRKDSYVLLDEPTNSLDIQGKRLLATYLQNKNGFILASHDREFLDQVIDHVLTINKCTIELEKGNYSTWRENQDQKEVFEARRAENLRREIGQLEKQAEKKRGWAGTGNKQKYEFCTNARANGAKAYMDQAKRAEQTRLNSIEEKKKMLQDYEEAKVMEFQQEQVESSILLLKHVEFSYGERPILENISFKIQPGDRLWIKGHNGSGKSTLLKLLLGECIPKSGKFQRMDELKIATVGQDPLWKEGFLTELEVDKARADRIREYCSKFDLSEETLKRPLESFSGGELRKLDVARALAEENQLLILDEPLNFMDVYFREQLEKAILTATPTMIFVEHDERFGNQIATKILDMDEPKSGNC